MGGATGRVFVSYRREDTRHMAGRLADRLNFRFGPGTVFMDVDAIEPGADFTRSIADAVSSCDVLIALIGPNWLVLDQRTTMPRIYEYDDFVAIEIKAALDRGIRVIPVLVDEAKMPTSGELPASLRPLATRNATRVDHETFSSDVERLLVAVERILRTVAAERTAPQQQYPSPGPPPTRAAPNPGRPRQHAESQQATAAQSIASPTGTPGPESRMPENSRPRPRPAVPPIRAALRIALWWLVGFTAVLTTFGLVQTITGGSQGGIVGAIGAIGFLSGVIAGLAALLRREIRAQRDMLRRLGPDGEARLSDSPVSARHVRKVATICAVVALALGLAFALTPTSGSQGAGTSTAR